jgi:hypothetical protein
MSYKSLATMITEGKTIKAVCPRCRGDVTVPTEVSKHKYRPIYSPQAQCHRCGVTFGWLTEEHPAGSTAVYPQDKGKFNVWFCDRVLDAPAPTIVE